MGVTGDEAVTGDKTVTVDKSETGDKTVTGDKAVTVDKSETDDKTITCDKAVMEQTESTEEAGAAAVQCQEPNGACRQKSTPRGERELRQLKNRLNRMIGQLNGIGKMLDDNRYCGDILTQVAAVESALQSFGYVIMQEHMETCVVEEIRKGNLQVVEEAVELMKKLK